MRWMMCILFSLLFYPFLGNTNQIISQKIFNAFDILQNDKLSLDFFQLNKCKNNICINDLMANITHNASEGDSISQFTLGVMYLIRISSHCLVIDMDCIIPQSPYPSLCYTSLSLLRTSTYSPASSSVYFPSFSFIFQVLARLRASTPT